MMSRTWKYSTQQRTEETFAMELSFEEDLTLHALRAFVEATKNIDGWAEVRIETGQRTGHDEVIVLRAITTDGGFETVEGPQLPDEVTVVDHEVVEDDGPRRWERAENVPVGVTFMSAAESSSFRWIRIPDDGGIYAIQTFRDRNDGWTRLASVTENWPGGFIEVRE